MGDRSVEVLGGEKKKLTPIILSRIKKEKNLFKGYLDNQN